MQIKTIRKTNGAIKNFIAMVKDLLSKAFLKEG